MPLVCNYYLTLRCNARCLFCNLWEQKDAPLADPDAVRRNIRQLPSAGIRIIDFTGGEPLLHPQLPDFLKCAKAANLKTTVTTNGLLYPGKAEALRGLVDLLHISIDGAAAETHDRLRGIKCYDKVMESIDVALSMGEQPDLLFTATADNYLDVIPLADFARGLGLVLIVNPVFAACGGRGLLDRAQLEELEKLCRRPYVYLNGGVVRIMKKGGNDPDNPRCRAVSSTVVISPQNELLLPCFHFAHKAVPITDRLDQVLASPERQEALKQQGRYNFCKGCTINCYLAPSLPYRFDRYFARFLPWAAKYLYYRSRFRQKVTPAA
jgi:MoaA/NifB/PqqE/SkfB family radical SAM enzyme